MIDLTADFGSLIEGLAAGDALMSLDRNPAYWDAVVDYAFQIADDEFNNSAAAYGETGAIKHMFEWGTLGVNRQATNVRPRPTEERARLWKNIVVNNGPKGGAWVDFEFKPSIADVPISTVIPQEVRALMRRHQFTWKAKVMEEGRPVVIRRQDAQFLLIPYSPGMTGFRPNDIKRGYTLTKNTIHAVPGRNTKGVFSAFWSRYWNSRGPESMSATMEKEITNDFLPFFAAAKGKKKVTTDIIAAVKVRSKEMQKEVAAKAKSRKMHGK